MNANMFSKCPVCNKFQMPPNVTVISYSLHSASLFCDGSCENVTRERQVEVLRYEDVLEEAERVLRGRQS
jgi:hypothetical protein